jgi:hypothetical protein
MEILDLCRGWIAVVAVAVVVAVVADTAGIVVVESRWLAVVVVVVALKIVNQQWLERGRLWWMDHHRQLKPLRVATKTM